MIKKIIVLQGIPASGKSTWARQWVSEDPEHRVRFNRDSLGCLTDEYKNTIDSDYIVDTCTWEK